MSDFFTEAEMRKLCQPWYKPYSKPAGYAQLPSGVKPLMNTYGFTSFRKTSESQVASRDLDSMLRESELVISRISKFAPLFKKEHEDKVKRIGNLRFGVITPAFEQTGYIIPKDGPRTPPSEEVKKEIVKYLRPYYAIGQKNTSVEDLRFIVDANLCYPIVSNLGPLNNVVFSVFALQAKAIREGKYSIDDLIRAEESAWGPRFAAQFSRVAMKGKALRVVLKDGSYIEQYGLAGADRLVAGVEKKFHFILRPYTKAFVKGILHSPHHNVNDVKTGDWITKCLKDKYHVIGYDSTQFDLHHGSHRLKAYIDIFCEVTGAPKDVCLKGSFSPMMVKTTKGTWVYQDDEWSQLLSGDPLTTIMNIIGVVCMVARYCSERGKTWSYDGSTDIRFKSWGDDMVLACKTEALSKDWIKWCNDNAMPGDVEDRIAFLGKWYNHRTGRMCYYDESLIKGIDPSCTESLKTTWSRRLGIIARLQLVSDPEKLFSFMSANWNEEAWGARFTMQDLVSVGTEAALKCSGRDINGLVRALYSGLGIDDIVDSELNDPLIQSLSKAGYLDSNLEASSDMMSITIDDIDAAQKQLLKVGQHFGVVAKRVYSEPNQDWLRLLMSTLKLRGGNRSPVF